MADKNKNDKKIEKSQGEIKKEAQKIKKAKVINWAKWAAIFGAIMVLLNLFLLTDFRITFPQFQKATYKGKTLEIPTDYKNQPLNVSPSYYIELIYKGADSIKFNRKLNFSIKLKDKGKKPVYEPEFKIYLIDSLNNLRGVFPFHKSIIQKEDLIELSAIKDEIEENDIKKRLKFSFNMPPEDQKVIGVWKILVCLYDGNNNELVAYTVNEFDVTDSSFMGWTRLLVVIFISLFTFILIIKTVTESFMDRRSPIFRKKIIPFL